MTERRTIAVDMLYESTGTAKLAELDTYCRAALCLAGHGNEITLTGPGPIWLYLKLAHALHGKVRRLCYDSPVTGEVIIYDHSPD